MAVKRLDKPDEPSLKPDGPSLKPDEPSLKPDSPSLKPDPSLSTLAKARRMAGRTDKPEPVMLELAFLETYTHGPLRAHYVKGKAYKFAAERAEKLLQEQDMGRPIWKVQEESSPPA